MNKEMNENELIRKIYVIRGMQVMLDSDLAEIYGYTTKTLNQQVRNNKEKFEDDFMFQLTQDETEYLRSKILTANISTKSRSNPYVFTEQGVYMLMTVLKGNLATAQSKILIRLFKQMKEYVLENQQIVSQRDYVRLTLQTADNTNSIHTLRHELAMIDDKIEWVANSERTSC